MKTLLLILVSSFSLLLPIAAFAVDCKSTGPQEIQAGNLNEAISKLRKSLDDDNIPQYAKFGLNNCSYTETLNCESGTHKYVFICYQNPVGATSCTKPRLERSPRRSCPSKADPNAPHTVNPRDLEKLRYQQ